jgi:superfamily II DNA or RNA helicase
MSAQDYFAWLRRQPEGWRDYETFAMTYLKLRPGFVDGWLFREIPISISQRLRLGPNDDGIDGLLERVDGKFVPVQIKHCRAPDKLLTRTCTKIDTAITRFQIYFNDNPDQTVLPIIITTYADFSPRSIIDRVTAEWIFRDEQLGSLGDEAVRLLQQLPTPTKEITLRSVQVEDLDLLEDDFNVTRKQRALFQAPMGYGKTLCMAEWIRRLSRYYNNHLVVAVMPYLKIVSQFRAVMSDYYLGRDYHPLTYTFASDGNGTDADRVSQLPYGDCPIVILTTYKSYFRLRQIIPVPSMVLFDEVHRLSSFDSNDEACHVGFTATPTSDVLKHFSPVVRRKLNWAISEGYLVDYHMNAFLLEETEDKAEQTKAYTAMILRALERSSHLLVICDSKEKAKNLTKEIRRQGIVSHSVTSEDSQEIRGRIERELRKAKKSVLTSVRIYREGADLPWLDGVFLTSSAMSQVDVVQTVGRVLRPHELKTIADVYFPIVGGNDLAESNNKYTTIINFLIFLAEEEPELFEKGSGLRSFVQKLTVHLGEGRGSSRGQMTEIQDGLLVDEIREQLRLATYKKTGKLLRLTSWSEVVSALLLKLNRPRVKVSEMKVYALQLMTYLGGTGKTPERTLSATMTESLKKYLTRVDKGTYDVDLEKIRQDFKKEIPEDFLPNL